MSGPSGAGSGRDAACANTKRPRRSPPRRLLTLLIGLVASLALPASAAAIDEFPVPNGGNPGGITTGPDGALWFTQEASGEIGRITTTGVVTNEFAVTAPSAAVPALDQIVSGPDGRLWFTMPRDHAIGAITTGGGFTQYPLPTSVQPEGITVGPDNNLWFTDFFNSIGRITIEGVHTLFGPTAVGPSDIVTGPDGRLWFTAQGAAQVGAVPTSGGPFGYIGPTGAEPSGITYVPGSGLWFTESGANQIGHINLGFVLSEYPGAGASPSAIAPGRDGALWFTESDSNAIGRITTGGTITNHFPVPTPASEPSDLTAGPDGALWFTERAANKVGRIDTSPPPAPAPVIPPRIPITTPTVVKKKPSCKVPKVKRLSVKKAKKKLKKARCKYRVRGRGFVVSTKPKAGKSTTKTVVVKAKPKKAKRRQSRAGGPQ